MLVAAFRTFVFLTAGLFFRVRSMLSFCSNFLAARLLRLPGRIAPRSLTRGPAARAASSAAGDASPAAASSPSSTTGAGEAARAVVRPRITVVGGGFGGLFTTLRLCALPWTRLTRPEITLVDREDRFVFLPMLYELVTGDAEHWEIAPLYAELLEGTGASFVQMELTELDRRRGVVKGLRPAREGADGAREEVVLGFDRAVLAVGTEGARFAGELEGEVLGFGSVGEAMALKERVRELLKKADDGQMVKMVIVGGGYSGVELASNIRDSFAGRVEVVLVERGDSVLRRSAPWSKRVGQRVLEERGVMVEYKAQLKKVTADEVVIQRKGSEEEVTLKADVVVMTAGTRQNEVLEGVEVPKDEKGRVQVDERLQVLESDGTLFALGDCAAVRGPGGEYGGTAQVAMQQAEYAAWNVWAGLSGKAQLDYKYSHLGEMMVLGSSTASLATPFGLNLNGKLAHAIRRTAYLIRMPTDYHRAKVAVSWAATPVINAFEQAFGTRRRAQTSEP